MKIFECSLDYHFPLNSFKISQKSSDFSVKNLNFLWGSGGLAPEPTYPESTKLLSFVLGADPRILGKNLKCKRNIYGKLIKIGQRRGPPPPEPPVLIQFSIILIFLSNFVQEIHAIFCKVNTFYITDIDKFHENFSSFGALRPPSPQLQHVHIRFFIFPII